MVRVVKCPTAIMQTMGKDAYGGWPLHGMPDEGVDTSKPFIRRRKVELKADTEQILEMTEDFDDCCCEPE